MQNGPNLEQDYSLALQAPIDQSDFILLVLGYIENKLDEVGAINPEVSSTLKEIKDSYIAKKYEDAIQKILKFCSDNSQIIPLEFLSRIESQTNHLNTGATENKSREFFERQLASVAEEKPLAPQDLETVFHAAENYIKTASLQRVNANTKSKKGVRISDDVQVKEFSVDRNDPLDTKRGTHNVVKGSNTGSLYELTEEQKSSPNPLPSISTPSLPFETLNLAEEFFETGDYTQFPELKDKISNDLGEKMVNITRTSDGDYQATVRYEGNRRETKILLSEKDVKFLATKQDAINKKEKIPQRVDANAQTKKGVRISDDVKVKEFSVDRNDPLDTKRGSYKVEKGSNTKTPYQLTEEQKSPHHTTPLMSTPSLPFETLNLAEEFFETGDYTQFPGLKDKISNDLGEKMVNITRTNDGGYQATVRYEGNKSSTQILLSEEEVKFLATKQDAVNKNEKIPSARSNTIEIPFKEFNHDMLTLLRSKQDEYAKKSTNQKGRNWIFNIFRSDDKGKKLDTLNALMIAAIQTDKKGEKINLQDLVNKVNFASKNQSAQIKLSEVISGWKKQFSPTSLFGETLENLEKVKIEPKKSSKKQDKRM